MQGILTSLRQTFKDQGATIKGAAAARGVKTETVSRWLNGTRPMPLPDLFGLLYYLGKEPREWLHQATGKADVLAWLGAKPLGRPAQLLSELQRASRSLAARREEPLPAASERPGFALHLRQGVLAARRRWIRGLGDASEVLSAAKALERYRHEDAAAAGRMARDLALRVCPDLGPGAAQAFCASAGVLASTLRVRGEVPMAAGVLRIILPLAEGCGPLGLQAQLLQRTAYVLRDRMAYEHGLATLALAGGLYLQAGDTLGVFKTLADRGIFLNLAGEPAEALPLLESMLKVLPEEEEINRLGVIFALGMALQALERHDEAADCLAQFERTLPLGQDYNRACLLLARGEALIAAKDPAAATGPFRRARNLFRGVNPYDEARAAVSLASALMALGKESEALAQVRGLAFILEPLEEIAPAAALAVGSLLRPARALTLESLKKASWALARALPAGQSQPAAY